MLNLWTQAARLHEADTLRVFCPDGVKIIRLSWSSDRAFFLFSTTGGHFTESVAPLGEWLEFFRRIRYKRPVRKTTVRNAKS
jgi:hypothetical protein